MADRADPPAFDLAAYLDRIGLDAAPPVTVEGLAHLVRAHRMAIPFGNLDILLGRGIGLAPQAIFDKLVHRRREGYCFEQNALLHRALDAIGFAGRPLMGRVRLRVEPGTVPPRTHQLELVTLDGRPWIADAGFGGSLTPPLPLAEGETGPGPDGVRFRLTGEGDRGWMFERLGAPSSMEVEADEAARWQAQYSFTTDLVYPADLEMGNYWTATHKESRFTGPAMLHRITPQGYASLNGNHLKWRDTHGASVTLLTTPADCREALQAHFGIALTQEEAGRLLPA
ncbi:MAG: arylamine N-acetyltransferase [Sphingobium sp.]